MPEWSAEIVVDEPVARRLLRQFPELGINSLRPLAEGWDYAIWVANEEWAFRFPRREVAIPGVELEIVVLPQLAPQLPLPVPVPEFVGEPTEEFPWPFFGSRLLGGQELCDVSLDDRRRTEIGMELAAFLSALHDARVDFELPIDGNRRADMADRVPKTREQLAEIEQLGVWRRPPNVDRLLAEAERLRPPPEPTAVVHGDVHFRQLLADDEGLTGVIDWVDICRSDPAIDLSMFWSFLSPEGREAFLTAYGRVSEEQLARARVVALSLCAALARYGHLEGKLRVEREALDGLERTTS
jgi:aminoglycoside phosphotransferase (APT) family kinase protein